MARSGCGRRPTPVEALWLLFGVAAFSGCVARERVEPLRDEAGRQVALEYVCPVVVRDLRSASALDDAVVYLTNDEDPIAQVGWTDASGATVLSQRYAKGTVVVKERLVFGLFAHEESRSVRFPEFLVRAARPGYLPEEERFSGERFVPGLDVGLAAARARLSEPVTIELEPVPAPVRRGASRHLAVLFAAPPRRQRRLGARGVVHDGRYVRYDAEGYGRLVSAVRALIGEHGERIAILASVPVASAGYHQRLAALASSADEVFYLPPLGPSMPAIDSGPLAQEKRRALRQLINRLGLVAEQPARRPDHWRRLSAPLSSGPAAPAISEGFVEAVQGWAALEKPDEVRETLRVLAFSFGAELEHGRVHAASLAGESAATKLIERASNARTLALVCEPAVAGVVERALRERRYRPIAETWLSAWRLR